MQIFKNRRSSAFSSACSTPKRIWKSAAAPQSRTCWWLDSWKFCRDWKIGLDQDWRHWVPSPLTQCKVERLQVGLMSWGTCFSLPLVSNCSFSLLLLPDSWFPSLCCSESEDSIDIELNSESSVQLRLCCLFFSHSHFSSRFDVLHTVI